MIKFEKVSYKQFKEDFEKLYPGILDYQIKDAYDHIKLPTRSSVGSCGYDIYCPWGFIVDKDEPRTIPLGIRVTMPEDMFLMIVPRSGVGFKTGVSLANTVGIIDATYYNSDNEGHIMLKLVPGFKTLFIQQGDRIVQGIFIKYYTTDDDNTTTIRNGGLGSSGK